PIPKNLLAMLCMPYASATPIPRMTTKINSDNDLLFLIAIPSGRSCRYRGQTFACLLFLSHLDSSGFDPSPSAAAVLFHSGCSTLEVAVAPNECIGRAIVLQRWLLGCLEFRDDLLGQDLAQLDAPLIKRIDLPDGSLRKDAVLVERHQLAESLRSQPFSQYHVRRTIAFEGAVR